MNICLFEDQDVPNLFPLAYTRPVYDLKCGMVSLREKVELLLPKASIALHCRTYLAATVKERNPRALVNELQKSDYLFLNGRVLFDESLRKIVMSSKGKDSVFFSGDQVVAATVSAQKIESIQGRMNKPFSADHFEGLPRTEIRASLAAYPWDLIGRNGEELTRDFERLRKNKKGKKIRGRLSKGVYLLGKQNIMIAEGADIKPGVVLDATDGPIYVGRNVKIFPQATIIGPASVGDQSWIKVGAQLYQNTSIGPWCKIGGEVEGSIIHGYSNKQHGGFLGHSYIGKWVNLGADTNNSDLKNNYGNVKVTVGTRQVDTGQQFVGLMMADHSKTAINSMFNTGTVVGLSCNIFGHGFPPKFLPSFAWGGAGGSVTTYDVRRAIDVARRVMARRKVEMTAAEEELLRTVFEITKDERRRCGVSDG